MKSFGFRLTNNSDPEERLEEAALWKAMHDEYGEDIFAIQPDDLTDYNIPIFGRGLVAYKSADKNPVSSKLEYWNDPAFLKNSGRQFKVANFNEARKLVTELHAEGKGAFLKSTKLKHWVSVMPVGTNFMDEVGDMAYSFIDGGPDILVQEFCHVEYEHRFFVIDRKIASFSPVQYALTPLDHPLEYGTVYKTPEDPTPSRNETITDALLALATKVAKEMEYPHASVDCALFNGNPAVIEFNPMQLGNLGLFACDVRALALASRKLIQIPSPDQANKFNP